MGLLPRLYNEEVYGCLTWLSHTHTGHKPTKKASELDLATIGRYRAVAKEHKMEAFRRNHKTDQTRHISDLTQRVHALEKIGSELI